MSELISVSKNNGVATVVIDNPPMNTLSNQVGKELYEVFSPLNSDNDVISIILTGAGERAFMAGDDINELPDRGKETTEDVDCHTVFNVIVNIPKPN